MFTQCRSVHLVWSIQFNPTALTISTTQWSIFVRYELDGGNADASLEAKKTVVTIL